MCEWLSQGEWCDVTLLCGGRSFNAHRAVLASVSKFLRGILLSCPADETSTFIVLPDFDLEAMSSVLYYIYNGEVIVQKNKLLLFLDIIQAMQIYIDSQYLPKICENIDLKKFDYSTCYSRAPNTDIFTLGYKHGKDQSLLNIKRGSEIHALLLQYSQSDLDFQVNRQRYQNGSKLCKPRLGNLKLPYADRQRSSFLRDLFIETYPRNGNVNGLTEGVLAISNECYHSPASVLSTNANGKHLNDDDTLSRLCKNTAQFASDSHKLFLPGQQLQCALNCKGNCGKIRTRSNSNPAYTKCPPDLCDKTLIYDKYRTATDAFVPSDCISILSQQYNETSVLSRVHEPCLDFRQLNLDAVKSQLLKDSNYSVETSHVRFESTSTEKRKEFKRNVSTKAIFNQVLENPWNPRKPNNYKPFQRRDEKFETENRKVPIENDTNNNIQTSFVSVIENFAERAPFASRETENLSSSAVISGSSFKCIHCNQVFTSAESLAVHMRRHSTNARYTCGECGKTFSQLRNFKYHLSIHRGTREFAATCTVCGKYFNDRGYLSSHMKIHRNRKEYKCTLCPKSFNQRVAYNMHVRIHTGVKPHVCEECGKAFSRKMLLKQHQRTHSGERPYACPHCEKRFADRSNMTLHLRLHTGVKPFSCTLCNKSFTKKHHLKSHLNFHTGSKPYSCPRCNLAFTQSSNMRTHLKKCNAPEPSSNRIESGNESQSSADNRDCNVSNI